LSFHSPFQEEEKDLFFFKKNSKKPRQKKNFWKASPFSNQGRSTEERTWRKNKGRRGEEKQVKWARFPLGRLFRSFFSGKGVAALFLRFLSLSRPLFPFPFSPRRSSISSFLAWAFRGVPVAAGPSRSSPAFFLFLPPLVPGHLLLLLHFFRLPFLPSKQAMGDRPTEADVQLLLALGVPSMDATNPHSQSAPAAAAFSNGQQPNGGVHAAAPASVTLVPSPFHPKSNMPSPNSSNGYDSPNSSDANHNNAQSPRVDLQAHQPVERLHAETLSEILAATKVRERVCFVSRFGKGARARAGFRPQFASLPAFSRSPPFPFLSAHVFQDPR
jgi:hypothetical protein